MDVSKYIRYTLYINIFLCSWKYLKIMILSTILPKLSNKISFCLSTYFAHWFQPASTSLTICSKWAHFKHRMNPQNSLPKGKIIPAPILLWQRGSHTWVANSYRDNLEEICSFNLSSLFAHAWAARVPSLSKSCQSEYVTGVLLSTEHKPVRGMLYCKWRETILSY